MGGAAPEASITLRPGERYVMGPTKLRYERTGPEGEPVDKDLPQSVRGVDFMENAPDTLEAFGLAEEAPPRRRPCSTPSPP